MTTLEIIGALVVGLLSAQLAFLALLHRELVGRAAPPPSPAPPPVRTERERDEDAEPTVVVRVGPPSSSKTRIGARRAGSADA